MMQTNLSSDYSYEQFLDEQGITQLSLVDDVADVTGDYWHNVFVPWADGAVGLAKDSAEWMAQNFVNMAGFVSRQLGFDNPHDDPEFNADRTINMSSAYTGTMVYYYQDEYYVDSIETAYFSFIPSAVEPGYPVIQGEHVIVKAVVRDANANDYPWLDPFDNGTGYRSIRINSGQKYGFDYWINGVLDGLSPMSYTSVDTDYLPRYYYYGGQNLYLSRAGQIKSIAYTTDKTMADQYESLYIPGGSYKYDDYMTAMIKSYNERFPDDPIQPSDVPTFEQAVQIVYPDSSGGGSGGSGNCYCEHIYQEGAFASGSINDVHVSIDPGGFGSGAFGAGAIGNVNIDGNVTIDGGLTLEGGTVTNNNSGTVNNTYSGGTVTNTYDGATVNQNFDGADVSIENHYDVTIDGIDLTGEEIEDIHTDIVKETVSLEELEDYLNSDKNKDEISAQLLNFIPDAMHVGFSVLDAWEIEQTFENSALIAWLFRILRGAV